MFCHRAHYPIAYILITTLCTGLQSCLLHLFPKFKGGLLRDRVHSVVLRALLQLSQLISLDFYCHFCHAPPKVNFDHTKVSFAFSVSSAVSTFAKDKILNKYVVRRLGRQSRPEHSGDYNSEVTLILCYLVQTWICLCRTQQSAKIRWFR